MSLILYENLKMPRNLEKRKKAKEKKLYWFQSPPNALTCCNSNIHRVDNLCVLNDHVFINVYIM